jgi:hypothetical protein
MEPPTRATRNLSSRRRGNHGSVLYISRRPAMITDQFNTGDRRHRWMSASRSTGRREARTTPTKASSNNASDQLRRKM